jgi:hypothetical protein
MRKRWLVPLTALCAMAGCDVVYVGDMDIGWTVSGATSSSACSTYGIASWRVRVSGPDNRSRTYACGTAWGTDHDLYGIAEGLYSVTVEALNAGGTAIGTNTESGVLVVSDVAKVTLVDINFNASDLVHTSSCGNGVCESSRGETASTCPDDCATSFVCGNGVCEGTKGETCTNCSTDCGSCAAGQLNVYWNINGTVDGSDKGTSWDTCAEVSASTVTVAIDGGTTQTFDCTGTVPGKMSGAMSVATGAHSVSVTLNGASGAITTTATGNITVSGSTPAEFYADFFFGSFLTIKSSMTGSYLFDTSYEGKSCTQTTPQVLAQVTLLKLNGTPVTAQVCGPDASCFPSDGVSVGKCYSPQQTQTIAGLKWGFYKLKIQGALDASTGGDICWETKNDGPQLPAPWPVIDNSSEVDILVGAGTTNPVVPHDLIRISTTGACM